MSKRGSPAVQVFIVIAVVGAFLYGFYSYHDKHTRLKRADESVEKLNQKTESLSAQLQVLYEHKTRLETAVTQEKEITKKAREDCDTQKTELLNQVEQQKRESADLAQQIESLQNKLEESNAATLKASQENQHLQQENENAVAKLNDELANVKRHLDECRVKPNVRSDNFKQDVDDRADARKVPADEGEKKPLYDDADDENAKQENMQVVAPKLRIANNQVPADEGERNQLYAADDENAKQENLKPKVASANNQVPADEGEKNQMYAADDENVKQENMQFFAPKVAGANNQSLAMGDDSELRQRDLVHEDNGADALQQQELERPVHPGREAKDEEYDNDIGKPQNL